MSRPTKAAQYEQAERWMTESFGYRMGDYLTVKRQAPISVAVVEIDRVLKLSGARELLTEWRRDDVLSAAGKKPILTVSAALGLLLLQVRLNRPTLITEMQKTFLEMSPRQRQVLALVHDGIDQRVYDRIGASINRLISLVDEFPGRKDKLLTKTEYAEVIASRDPADCRMRRERMFTLANALLEGTRRLLPTELRDRSHGNFAQDATCIAMQGKAGNPARDNMLEDRKSINSDAGNYGREGSHGAITHSDARVRNKADPTANHKGTSKSKSVWAIEAEIARDVDNLSGERNQFPLLTIGVGFHIPGAITGEGARMVKSLYDRGHKINFVLVDRAYPAGKLFDFHVRARQYGAKLVFDYQDRYLGQQAHRPDGIIQVSGSWYLDNLPEVHQEMDRVVAAARKEFESDYRALRKNLSLKDADRQKRQKAARVRLDKAEAVYGLQLAERAKYMLTYKGHMSADGTRRYLMPTGAPGYAAWKAKPKTHQGETLMMKLPTLDEAETDKNAGGLKNEQYFPFGTPEWSEAYAKRNGVESVNRNLKRSQYEDIGNADKRAVRGNSFTYMVVAVATVIENLRKIIDFYQAKLAVVPVTAKNSEIPRTFWQSSGRAAAFDHGAQPPG